MSRSNISSIPSRNSSRDSSNVSSSLILLPGITVSGITNAASSLPGGIAPNEFITIWGEGLGPASGGYSGPMTTVAAGTTVYIGGIPAPILYSSARQVNALVPFGVARRGATTVQVEYNGVQGNVISLPVG